jgi:hypothetical protein
MNAEETTPRPWSVNDWPQRDADIRIGAAGTPLIATVHLMDTSINGQRANTALIIRAVNSFDAMRDALRMMDADAIAARVRAMSIDSGARCEEYAILLGEIGFAARAALALADQETQP